MAPCLVLAPVARPQRAAAPGAVGLADLLRARVTPAALRRAGRARAAARAGAHGLPRAGGRAALGLGSAVAAGLGAGGASGAGATAGAGRPGAGRAALLGAAVAAHATLAGRAVTARRDGAAEVGRGHVHDDDGAVDRDDDVHRVAEVEARKLDVGDVGDVGRIGDVAHIDDGRRSVSRGRELIGWSDVVEVGGDAKRTAAPERRESGEGEARAHEGDQRGEAVM